MARSVVAESNPAPSRPEKLLVSLEEAEQWTESFYGKRGRATRLAGEIDVNFLLTDDQDQRWILKIAPADSNPTALDCQLTVLEYLEQRIPTEPIPRLVRDQEGRASRTIRTQSGALGRLRLVSFLPGQTLAELEHRPPELDREIGAFLARLDTALLDFDHPGARREFFWDVTRILELRPYLDWIAQPLRGLVEHHLGLFEQRVLPHVPQLPKSIIHNDANDHNLLASAHDRQIHLAGIIDFGDMIYTVTVAEVAIASTYLMLRASRPLHVAERVLDGYTSTRSLSELERELIPSLITARLCNSLLMSAQARKLNPEDEYLTISEEASVELLETLTS